MFGKCRELVDQLDGMHRLQETYRHARARFNELKDGDENTSYLHPKAQQRKKAQFNRLT